LITPTDAIQRFQFRIEVYEQSGNYKIDLLDTEFSIPEKNITVFGFEDTHGKPYFLSFRVVGWTAEADSGGRKSLVTVKAKPVQEEPKGAVKATGDIKPPRLIKMVNPVYPETARKAGLEGVVILEATTDIYGRIVNVRVLRSIPDLDQAAIDAVKQWIYEPVVINGKPRTVTFTVTVTFRLK
jgi:TonB family protein